MATARLIGGPNLRARLNAIKGIPAAYGEEWAIATAERMRATKPPSDRPESSMFLPRVRGNRAGVYGAFWWIFVDRGTRAHDITPRRREWLKFTARSGETIFAKRTHHPRIARRPFISRAAQDALAGSAWSDLVIKTWNTRRLRTKRSFL